MIGWANVAVTGGKMQVATGYVRRCPESQAFRRALNAELARMERFLTARTAARLGGRAAAGPGPSLG